MNMLPNIPAVWSALAYWLACLLYLSLLPRRRDGWRSGLFMICHFVVLTGYMSLTANWQDWMFNLGMVVTAALTAVPFLVLCRHRGRTPSITAPGPSSWAASPPRCPGSCMRC